MLEDVIHKHSLTVSGQLFGLSPRIDKWVKKPSALQFVKLSNLDILVVMLVFRNNDPELPVAFRNQVVQLDSAS